MIPSRASLRNQIVDAVLLCIDDDELILDVVQTTLEKHGYSVLTATNGNEALELFKENAIDLVLVDYEMPGMNGHEVTKEIRNLNPRVPIVLHSGAPNIPATALRAADAFIAKGTASQLMLAAIAELITSKRMNAQPERPV